MNTTPRNAAARIRHRAARRRGLTLIEVLATIVMMAIVLPASMQGISMCMSASIAARQRSEAAALAEAKLAQLIAVGDWQYGNTSGDFGDAWPEYRWSAASADWTGDATANMTELSIRVYWTSRQQERDVVLTTLLYNGQSQTTSTSTN
jgi:prepilin-type N-terminal cleavage/methylation domain-containing protein